MGAAGDMLTAALFELLSPTQQDEFLGIINQLGLDGVSFSIEKRESCGISGSHVNVLINGQDEYHYHHQHHEHLHDHVHSPEHCHEKTHSHDHEHEHHHSHSSLHDIEHIISHLNVLDNIKEDVVNIYKLIADAESKAHGKDVSMIHFHEVGMMDAIVDITSVCLLIGLLSPERIYATPVHVGSGTVKCAHGIMPVPAPATANLLVGIPCYSKDVEGELCTPTGAALLKYFVHEFKPLPPLTINAIGYGIGTKEFKDHSNSLRAILADAFDENPDIEDIIYELNCNVDDMTGEEAGFAIEAILESGAREAFFESVIQKKSRPGLKLTVIVDSEYKNNVISSIFKYTSTIGIRESEKKRYILNRSIDEINTEFGVIHKKTSAGYGVVKSKWEYEDIARIAKEKQLSIREILSRI